MVLLLLLSLASAYAQSLVFNQAPAWFNARKAEKVVDRIQSRLEWDLRKTQVTFYPVAASFARVNDHGPEVLAFARKSDSSVHLSPKVTETNFDSVFGHELAHIIVAQKYKQAIPAWLEEGLANYVSRHGQVDYAWLKSQQLPPVESLSHPFKGIASAQLHYMLSTATMEFLAAKCSFADLLQLSVGKKLESFLKTYCEIGDLNHELAQWIGSRR
jgi:hypothetical protein